jgi:hypothetical protein
MKAALVVVIGIMLIFTALGIACAVIVALRRKPLADPYAAPFGDMPAICGMTLMSPNKRHLESGRIALQPESGGRYSFPSTAAAARNLRTGAGHVAAR